ncbi:MAG: polyhydroxyalkanoate depolymerase [Janthinobacterium lividum]
MQYQAFQAHADFMEPVRQLAAHTSAALAHPMFAQHPLARSLAAALGVFSAARMTHQRVAFGIHEVELGGNPDRKVAVHEEVVATLPFAKLVHFRREGVDLPQPRVLIAAPMSGHFATLLRDTVKVMLQDHDVYITDWHNARDVPLSEGRFGLDEYTAYLIDFLERIGPGSHLMAICQPCVSALAAVSVMAADKNPAQPASMILMAGPIDCRINPTKVNALAMGKPYSWFEQNLISRVPFGHAGAQRPVYPGFLQLTAFMSMNLPRHIDAFRGLHRDLLDGEIEKADTTRAFYEEYFAVLDMTAEFYLETIKHVFQDHDLARGTLTWRGRPVDPGTIRHTSLLTVEGERDDICALGQTMAAQDLCSNIPPVMKSHHMQAGVGHYGTFSGRRWAREIYPHVREMIYSRM